MPDQPSEQGGYKLSPIKVPMPDQPSEQQVEEALAYIERTDFRFRTEHDAWVYSTLAAALRERTAERDEWARVGGECQRQLRERDDQEARDNVLRQLADEESERAAALTADNQRLREALEAIAQRADEEQLPIEFATTRAIGRLARAALYPTEQESF